MISIVWRQIKKTFLIQISLAALFASAIIVLMIYGSYISQENRIASSRITERIPAGHYLVATQQAISSNSASASLTLVGLWQQLPLGSSLGRLPAVLIGKYGPIGDLAPLGTAIIPSDMAQRFNLRVGSSFVINYAGERIEVAVHAIYSNPSSTYGFDFGGRALFFLDKPIEATNMLYTTTVRDAQWALNNLQRAYPGAKIYSPGQDPDFSRLISQSNSVMVQRSKASLAFFVAVAFLTAKVLGFLDNRRILAILKAIGVKNIEVSYFMLLDAVIAPLAGAVGGGALGFLILKWFEQKGSGLSFTTAILIQALFALVPALAIGVYVPARLAKMGSVNELAHERNISLLYEKVDGLAKRAPGLDPYLAQGYRFVRFDCVDGVFDGYVFRKIGDVVRQGEVLALSTSWWGLKNKEFVAPISGTVAFYEPITGVMGIAPND